MDVSGASFLRGLLASLVNAAVLGYLSSVSMAGSPNSYQGAGPLRFLGSYCGLKENPLARCWHLDLLLGPHGLGTLTFTLRLVKR